MQPRLMENNNDLQMFRHIFVAMLRVSTSLAAYSTNFETHAIMLKQILAIDFRAASIFLKLEILKYIRQLLVVKNVSTDHEPLVVEALTELFNRLFNDDDIILKTMAYTSFADAINLIKYEQITLNLTSDQMVKKELRSYVKRKITKILPSNEYTIHLLYLGGKLFIREKGMPIVRDQENGETVLYDDNNTDDESQPELKKCKIDVDQLIDRMYDDANSIHELYKKDEINSEQMSSIKEILIMLEKIVDKH